MLLYSALIESAVKSVPSTSEYAQGDRLLERLLLPKMSYSQSIVADVELSVLVGFHGTVNREKFLHGGFARQRRITCDFTSLLALSAEMAQLVGVGVRPSMPKPIVKTQDMSQSRDDRCA